MSASSGRSPRLTGTTWWPPVQPSRPDVSACGALVVDDAVAVQVLAASAAAACAVDLGRVLAPLRALPGVRGALLGEAAHRRGDLVVLASDGYDCAVMATGAVLPADSGMLVVESVRQARTVVQGTGPSWIAVPVPRTGGRCSVLLLSLTCPPPVDPAPLERLGAALGPVLDRLRRAAQVGEEVALLEEGLAVPRPRGAGLVVRGRPYEGRLSGDVVALEEVGGARWLLVADVSGRGAAAAVVADRLRAAFAAVVPAALSPADVLRALDRAVCAGTLEEERFATALVLRLRPGPVVASSAGHPAPLLRTPEGVRALAVPAGPPLGLGLDGVAGWSDAATGVRAGVLVAWTDGLLDRGREADLPGLLEAAQEVRAGVELAEVLEAGCAAVGPQQDDATLVVLELEG